MKYIEKIMNQILKSADKKQENAGYGGEMGDGGAGVLREQVKFYQYGQDDVIPGEWENYEKKLAQETDPDYEVYLKLKKKFE